MIKHTILKRVDNVGYLELEMFPHWTRLLIWALQLEKSPYMKLCGRLSQIWRANGPQFVVTYTKECVRILQAYVSGNPILVTEVVVGLVGGLPSVIPGALRTLLRSGDRGTIRGCLSILQVYRVISYPGKLKLSTITDPFKGLSDTLPKYEVIRAVSSFRRVNDLHTTLKPIKLKFLSTAGPNHSTSMLGIFNDIVAWRDSELLPTLLSFIKRNGSSEEFLNLLTAELAFLKEVKSRKTLYLGKLSEKLEAAGKIRVFAITDAITQSVMSPISDYIFDLLRTIPMDGTFDQDAPLRRLVDRVRNGDLLKPTFYSYDLSAATDRLPIALQKQVLSCFFGDEFADEWSKLLVDRPWYLKLQSFVNFKLQKFTGLKYSVGQPMGALSSWAMLAMTHHVVVRICAIRLGKADFTDYAILGDDVVIADEAIAKAYHELMTVVLGVDINLSKSLVSTHSFEFAKRLITLDGEVSPIGSKNLLVGLKSVKGIPSILLDLKNKGFEISEEMVDNMYAKVPTLRKSQMLAMRWLVKGPFGFIPTADGLTARLKLSSSLSAVMMDSLLSSIDQALHESKVLVWEANLRKAGKVIYSLRHLHEQDNLDIDLNNSPLLQYMIATWVTKANELIGDKPVRRFIFDGPLVFTNYYREGWMLEMMKYITSKLKSNSDVTVPLLDPFKSDRVILPLSSNMKSEKFWDLVRKIEDEKSAERGFKGW